MITNEPFYVGIVAGLKLFSVCFLVRGSFSGGLLVWYLPLPMKPDFASNNALHLQITAESQKMPSETLDSQ